MRLPLVVGLSLSMLLSCTAPNAAYSGSGESGMAGVTSASTTSGTSLSTTSTGSDPESTDDSKGPTSAPSETAAPMPTGTGEDLRCWSTPIYIEDLLPAGAPLSNVPVRVATSRLGATSNPENLRFYQDGQLLPYELEAPGRIAWVQLRNMTGGVDLGIEAVMGAACRDVPDPLPASDVWSAGYVAVFHFDNGAGVPPTFLDSVDDIALVADANTDTAESMSFLGSYAQKSGNGALLASDDVLDIFGQQPVSVLGWVLLEKGEATVLPPELRSGNARHRELLGKLPGYRLNAVRGYAEGAAEPEPHPFFNLSQEVPGGLQDNIPGSLPVEEGVWTMLAGTYDGTDASLFVNDQLANMDQAEYIPGSDVDAQLRVGRWLHGGIDEVRISTVARSANWLRVQHASMTGTLVDYGIPHEL